MCFASAWVIKCPFLYSAFPLISISAAKKRPSMFCAMKLPMPDALSRPIARPSFAPQSSSVITTSCATSKSRRVKYPAFAVLSAVSERPLRDPWVVIKYSIGERPSFMDLVIGNSIASPVGEAMRPFIPAIWVTWPIEPRAPEVTMSETGPFLGSVAGINFSTSDLAACHTSMFIR